MGTLRGGRMIAVTATTTAATTKMTRFRPSAGRTGAGGAPRSMRSLERSACAVMGGLTYAKCSVPARVEKRRYTRSAAAPTNGQCMRGPNIMWRKRFVWRAECFTCIVDHIVQGCAVGVVAQRAAHSFQRFGMTQTSISSETLTAFRNELAEKYRLERELGQGGMAIVYLAHDLVNDQLVALKVLNPELAATLGADRFLREIEVGRTLQHPNIVGVIDSGEANGRLFYTMPFVEGASLRDKLDREKQLSIDEAIDLTKQIAEALGYAHSKNVIHRDIKPENILLSEGRALVADFGIARAVSVAGREALTRTGMAVGTPTYMSPEQAVGRKDVTPEGDVSHPASGVSRMLAGQTPVSGPAP